MIENFKSLSISIYTNSIKVPIKYESFVLLKRKDFVINAILYSAEFKSMRKCDYCNTYRLRF